MRCKRVNDTRPWYVKLKVAFFGESYTPEEWEEHLRQMEVAHAHILGACGGVTGKIEVIRRNVMRYDAFFISPTGKFIPVLDRHIVKVIQDPKAFGWTSDGIVAMYKKHHESVGFEGYARNEIILDLLKKDWVRLRFFERAGAWRLQIHEEMNSNVRKNIRNFCHKVKQGYIVNMMHRNADPQIEIHDTLENTLFLGALKEGIEFLKQQSQLARQKD